MSFTFTTSGAAIAKAGLNQNAIFNELSGATILAGYSDDAEGYIETETKIAFLDNYAGLTTGTKNTLNMVTSALMAQEMVGYDTTGYLSREADTLLNVNDDKIKRGIKALKQPSPNKLKTP